MLHLADPLLITLIDIGITFFVTAALLFYRYIYPKKQIKLLILLFIISAVPTISLFREGVFRGGDIRFHAIQLISFYQNLREGILLPQWGGNLCGTFGCPVFEFIYILPYYIASLFHFIGFSVVTSMKLELAFSFIVSGFTMYLWAKQELHRNVAFAAAVFYLFAPFHLIDLHFKGDVGETLSFVFIPLLFYFATKIIEKHDVKSYFLEAITILFLLLSHAGTAIITVPLAAMYGIVISFRKNTKKKKVFTDIFLFVSALVYGALLSAFYWLPAQFEVTHTWYSLMALPNDFKPISEYLYSPIAYGFLFQGHQGEYRLIIGYVQIVMIVVAIILLMKNKVASRLRPLLIFFLIAFFALFFMLLPVSQPIWNSVYILHSFMVVWRILCPIDFITATIAGIVIMKLKNNGILILLCFIVITSTILNWANRVMVPFNPNQIYAFDLYTEYFQPGNPVYLKRYNIREAERSEIVSNVPRNPIEFLKGKGTFIQITKNQQYHEYIIQTTKDSLVKENTYYFPGWTVYANNKNIPINYEYANNNDFGKITFFLKKGLYKIDVVFNDSPLRTIAKKISIFSFLIGIIFLCTYWIIGKSTK